MKKGKEIIYVIISVIISLLLVFLNNKNLGNYHVAYIIYKNGEEIGLTKNKNDLENYVNDLSTNKKLKSELEIDRVYLPDSIKVEKIFTNRTNYDNPESIYEKVNKDLTPYIDGYKITIAGLTYKRFNAEINIPSTTIYVREKEVFDKAMEDYIKLFVSDDEYDYYFNKNKYIKLNSNTELQKIKIANNIKVSKKQIPIDKNIFTDSKELTYFLLIGKSEGRNEYIVSEGENIEKVAAKNKLSPKEFLMVNRNIKNEKELLYPGQKVLVSQVNPLVAVEKRTVETNMEVVKYDKDITYDNNKSTSYEEVIRPGSNGQVKTTYKYKYLNGFPAEVEKVSIETLKPAVNEKIVLGNKKITNVGRIGYWRFPTVKPYILTSCFGYGCGLFGFHDGLDLSIPGNPNAPVYATNNGTVIETRTGVTRGGTCAGKVAVGNFIQIDHNNGYTSSYLHLSKVLVNTGETVEMGQLIGYIGNTGCSFGHHLHFSIYAGRFYVGTPINPFSFVS